MGGQIQHLFLQEPGLNGADAIAKLKGNQVNEGRLNFL